jgi:hypothetical protein
MGHSEQARLHRRLGGSDDGVKDVGRLAQAAAEKHLAACFEAYWSYEEGGEEISSPAIAPFDGCDTCIVREVLWAAWPYLEEIARMMPDEPT